jgi:hypothetical protein
MTESITSGTSVAPFYYQPTLGGQDINNQFALGSIRLPVSGTQSSALLQESFEHSS